MGIRNYFVLFIGIQRLLYSSGEASIKRTLDKLPLRPKLGFLPF